jgi:ATP-dependent DNA helicase RecG
VATAFFRAGEIEAWGRGIQRIFAACREAETPEPRVLYDPGDMSLEFPFSAAYLEIIPGAADRRGLGEGGGDRVGETGKVTGKMTGEMTGKTPGEMSGKAPARILELLQHSPYLTVPEIARQISKSESTVLRGLRTLQIAGRLKRIGPAKGGHWEVQK